MSVSSIGSGASTVLPQSSKLAPDGDAKAVEGKETRNVILAEKFNGGFTPKAGPTGNAPAPSQPTPTASGLNKIA
jgi:hypothetical protein